MDQPTIDLAGEVGRLRAEVERLHRENARLGAKQRTGQRVFNAVCAIDRGFAESRVGSSVDPFDDDTRCEAFLRAWAKHIRREMVPTATRHEAQEAMERAVPAAVPCCAICDKPCASVDRRGHRIHPRCAPRPATREAAR